MKSPGQIRGIGQAGGLDIQGPAGGAMGPAGFDQKKLVG
jgi:hypothetical protein